MSENLITVVMPAYNAERFIQDAINSVLAQTYSNWELIIVNDNSQDSTIDIITSNSSKDNRIKFISNEVNLGVAKSRNKGILMAHGDYIALLDSDDVWVPNKLEKQLDTIKKYDAQIVYCSYDFIDENNNKILKPFIVPETTNFKKMLYSSVMSCSTNLIEAKLLKNNLFNPGYYHEDYVLWMSLLKLQVKAIGITTVLTHYRQVSGSRSNNKLQAAKERWNIYRKALNLNFVKSLISFIGYSIKGIIKYFL